MDLKFEDIFLWKEACASCAIEDNEWAEEILEVWKKDKSKFIQKILEVTKNA